MKCAVNGAVPALTAPYREPMPTLIFVNLMVSDLPRAKAFFTALGYSFDPQYTDDNAACLVISDTIYAMLLVPSFFATFTPKPMADPGRSTEVIVSLGVESRARVDELCTTAFAHGGRAFKEAEDHGFMYGWGFEDPDGHLWEVIWMDHAVSNA